MSSYEDLARHNQVLAANLHARTRRQQIRSLILRTLARVPIPAAHPDDETILLIRPDHLGDTLLTSPAIQALARTRPNARLVALVGPWSAGVISAYPEVALTLTIPFPGFVRNPTRTSLRPYRLAWQWARQLRQLRASSAIIFRPDHWWGALLVWLVGIPQRVGFDLPDVAPFLTHALPFAAGHAVEHNMALVSPWVSPQPAREDIHVHFPVEEADRLYIEQELTEHGFPPHAPRILIHPGSGTLIKQWAPAHWARVADHLAKTWGAPVIFTGSDREIQLVRSITDLMAGPVIIMAGETNVHQLAALYEGARVVLGPDSGPLHLAAAVGTPTVHLFGPADPAEFGPWGDPAKHAVLTSGIACQPCRILDWPGADPAEHPCVRDIAPDDVIAAALRVSEQR